MVSTTISRRSRQARALYFSPPYYNLRFFQTLQQFPLLLNDPFPSNYPIPIPSSAFAIQRDLATPYVQHWNVNVQQQLGRNRVLEIGYVASKGNETDQPARHQSAAAERRRSSICGRIRDSMTSLMLESRGNSDLPLAPGEAFNSA